MGSLRGPDADDFDAFVTASSPALLRTACLLTGDAGRAEDLVQTVLAKLYLRWGSLDDVRRNGALHAYARTALVRQSTSWWRRAWTRERPIADLPEPAAGDDPTEQWAERDRLVRHLDHLPARQRAALVLRFLDDLPEAEVAAALGCSVGTVKSHTHRGLARMRTLLAAELAADARDEEVTR